MAENRLLFLCDSQENTNPGKKVSILIGLNPANKWLKAKKIFVITIL